MINPGERFHQRALNQFQIAHRQVAFIELAIEKPGHRQIMYDLPDAGMAGFALGAGRTFGGIRKHQDGDLAVLWFWSAVSELHLRNLRAFGLVLTLLLLGLVEKVGDQRRAVMLLDERQDDRGKIVFLRQRHAVFYMADDDMERHVG